MPLIDPARLIPLLGPLAVRFDVDALDSCDSTSDEILRRQAHGSGAGTVIVADRQTAGRGRRGRHWQSSPEASLTFSLLWRFADRQTPLGGLSLAVGIAVSQALEKLGAAGVRLKWPNDVLLQTPAGEGKLAGILIELSTDRRGTQAVIGIGLNLLPPRLADRETAGLTEALAPVPDRHVLLAALLCELQAVLDIFTVNGFAGLKPAWQERHAWQDRAVEVLGERHPVSGQCLGVDDSGALLIATPAGLERVLAGDVSLRTA